MAALSTHDVAHDLSALAITAAKRRPLPVLPLQPLDKEIRELADSAHLEIDLQQLMTAPSVTVPSKSLQALLLSNQWSKVFRREEELACDLVEDVEANEEERLKTWYRQARQEVINAAATIKFGPTCLCRSLRDLRPTTSSSSLAQRTGFRGSVRWISRQRASTPSTQPGTSVSTATNAASATPTQRRATTSTIE